MKKKSYQFAPALLLVLGFAFPYVSNAAEPARQLTPVQMQKIERIKQDLLSAGCIKNNYYNDREIKPLMEEAIKSIDPILVGKNVMYGPKWLEVIGNNKPLSRQ